jgi:hypothetical protein
MLTFLNPLFLWAAAAALIPLVLHLMQRRRTVRVMFSTLRFLQQAHKRSVNRLRMENILLWLARTMLMLLIALAFAMPIVRTTAWGGFMGSALRDVAIVWDVSYSMGYDSGQRNVWESSRHSVAAIVQSLRAGDRVCLFLAGESAVPLIEQPTGDLELALSLIRAQQPRPSGSQLAPAALAALDALKQSGGRERELYLVTDGQALPWRGFETAELPASAAMAGPAGAGGWDASRVDRDVAFFVALLGPLQPDNAWPHHVEVQPRLLLANTPARVTLRLGHTGPARPTSVALIVGERELGRRNVLLTPGVGEEVSFNLPPLEPGIHAARVETPADGLLLDNAFHFLLRVKDRLSVLVAGPADDAFFLVRALNPRGASQPSAIRVKRIEPAALDTEPLDGHAVVFLCNALPLPGQALLALEQYVRDGGLLAMFPGDRATLSDYESWSVLPARPTGAADVEPDAANRPLRLLQPADPLFRALKLPPGVAPTVTVRRELTWPQLPESAEAILGATADQPLLLSRRVDAGRVLVFSVSADRRWSDLPLSPLFLPMLHEITQFGAGLAQQQLFVWTDQAVELADRAAFVLEGSGLVGPSGEMLTVRRARTPAEPLVHVDGVSEPGVYRLSLPGGLSGPPVLAANVPRAESDLTPIPSGEIARALGIPNVRIARDREELLRLAAEHRVGRPLSESLLWAILLLAVAEVLLANRLSRRVAHETRPLAVDPAGRVRARPARPPARTEAVTAS